MKNNHAGRQAMSPQALAARRRAVLVQCRESQQAWEEKPGRTLMLFLDGTGNMLGSNEDTNVVRLFRATDKSAAARQIAYYDPGVGSANEFPSVHPVERRLRRATQLVGLALGHGVFDNIAQAYSFLVGHYQEGDRICIFGFSRGAFTARAVGGMVNMYGLVHPSGLAILPSLVRSYFSPKGAANRAGRVREDFAGDVIRHFALGRTPLVHFVGVWDTVESVGIDLFGRGLKISNNPTVAEKRFVHVRHALALHETRCKYAPRNYTPPGFDAEEQRCRSFDERWFRGNHSDIGGSYAEDGLSSITLQWMLQEAAACGMRFTPGHLGTCDSLQPVHDQTVHVPFWVWTGLNVRTRGPDEPLDPSAQPVDAATPALPMRRAAPRMWWLGWALAAVTAGLGWQVFAHGLAACHRGGGTFPLVGAQLLAPWLMELGVSCDGEAVHRALRWDWVFLAAYALLLAWPVAWSVRRAAPAAVAAGRPLGRLARHMPWLMLGLVGADGVENLLSSGLGDSDSMHRYLETAGSGLSGLLAAGLTLASACKLVCLVLLARLIARPG